VTGCDDGSWRRGAVRGTTSSVAHHDQVARALVAIGAARDIRGLTRLLHPGVALTVDGGGRVPAPQAALEGATEAGIYLAHVLLAPGTALRVDAVNGMPGVIVCRDAAVTGILGFRVRRRRIVEAWLVLNPEKLTRWSCS
jgi:RNA polymerase sigma-70 factor (ECF subfamily)